MRLARLIASSTAERVNGCDTAAVRHHQPSATGTHARGTDTHAHTPTYDVKPVAVCERYQPLSALQRQHSPARVAVDRYCVEQPRPGGCGWLGVVGGGRGWSGVVGGGRVEE